MKYSHCEQGNAATNQLIEEHFGKQNKDIQLSMILV